MPIFSGHQVSTLALSSFDRTGGLETHSYQARHKILSGNVMAFRIRKKRIGSEEVKRRNDVAQRSQAKEQEKRQELAESDAIAGSAKHPKSESDLELFDEDS